MANRDILQLAPLPRLPDEILLNVLTRLEDAPSDLRHLALTHSRVRPIAQEALVRAGRLTINSIPRYIELLDAHPGWIEQVKRIEFYSVPPDYSAFDPYRNARKACARRVRALDLSIPGGQLQGELATDLLTSEHWVLVLLAILPNAATLTIGSHDGVLDSRYAALLSRQSFDSNTITSLRNKLLDLVDGRLKTVSISMDKTPNQVPKLPFRLSHFKALETCTLSGEFISGVHFKSPAWLLPSQLKTLRLTCSSDTCPWDWMDWLQQLMMRGNVLPNLRCIQLFVTQPCRSFAGDVESSPILSTTGTASQHAWFISFGSSRRDVLEEWESMEVVFQTYFADTTSDDVFDPAGYTEADVLQELRSMEEEEEEESSVLSSAV